MSIEMHVLFRGKLPNKTALSRAMAELGFPFTIPPGSLERQRGFMPMRFRREESGVEFDVWNDRAAVEDVAGEHFRPGFERSANFRWGGAEDEMLAANCAAAALAKLVDGVVLEEMEDKLLSPDEAIALARERLNSVLKPAGTKRRGTRPADIRHYLKPLLKQRPDLVLVGRLLLVRPVRHILRAVFLDRTSDKYSFRIWPYLKPLWGSYWSVNDFPFIDMCPVWQPHFEPLLMDVLQQDIFALFGRVTTHEELVATLPDDHHDRTRVMALILAGASERAEAYVRLIEESKDLGNPFWRDWVKSQRDLLDRDVSEVCQECHAAEAKAVKAKKLERFWEPSPFPVEVPPAERDSRTAEPIFATKPWPAPPPDLLPDLPRAPGDVRFAKDWTRLGRGNPILVAALTREQAEERHRNGEGYVLAARLADGALLVIRWHGRDRLDPWRADGPNPDSRAYASGFFLWWYGSDLMADAHCHAREGMLELGSVGVDERATRTHVWGCSLDSDKGFLSIWNYRGGERYQRRSVTVAEIAQFRCPPPAFGEFDAIVRTMLTILRTAGYGDLTY